MSRITRFFADGLRIVVTLSMLAVIRSYQRIVSPWLPQSCRFRPTCSAYAAQAVLRYGPVRGGLKAVQRVLRCHPWNAGGWDPP